MTERIWKQDFELEALNGTNGYTLVGHLGIEITEIGDDYLKATMPVDERTFQPMRLLHGGASVALAETLGSVASLMCLEDLSTQQPVGVEINANHMRSATSGKVTGTCTPLKVGRKMHVWRIVIEREDGKQICESRITVAVIDRKKT